MTTSPGAVIYQRVKGRTKHFTVASKIQARCKHQNTHVEQVGHVFPSFGEYDDDFQWFKVCNRCGRRWRLGPRNPIPF